MAIRHKDSVKETGAQGTSGTDQGGLNRWDGVAGDFSMNLEVQEFKNSLSCPKSSELEKHVVRPLAIPESTEDCLLVDM